MWAIRPSRVVLGISVIRGPVRIKNKRENIVRTLHQGNIPVRKRKRPSKTKSKNKMRNKSKRRKLNKKLNKNNKANQK